MVESIQANMFGLMTHKVITHAATVPGGIDPADLLDPILWNNVKARIKMGDRIDVVADDYSFHAVLFVTYADGHHIKTKLLTYTPLDVVEGDFKEDERFIVKMRGPKKWSVLDAADGKVLVEMIPTRPQAYAWLESHVKALAA
jgi:hypothetical protein